MLAGALLTLCFAWECYPLKVFEELEGETDGWIDCSVAFHAVLCL